MGLPGVVPEQDNRCFPTVDSHHKWNWKGAGPPRNMSNLVVGQETIPPSGNGFHQGLFQSITAISPPLIHIIIYYSHG
jgi:hypothetical protein